MPRTSKKKVKDLFEMIEDHENIGYIGSDIDQLELYEQELADLEESEENYEGNYDSEDNFE